ncbi:MAG: hypothetical protein CSA26_05200 [Desulfobacterales bacterium]|nr:MAG: hypothetical protein CSA26_05200 [Desulfobacterales bacterium]
MIISKKTIKYCLVLVVITYILSVILLASVPPTSLDALIHHLYIPRLYLEHGGIFEIPDLVYSYYPMNLDLLYMIPLFLGNDIIPKYIHFLFALLTALLIYRYLKRKTNSIYALVGALFFLSIPVILKLSITAYVDLGLIFFTTASLLLLFRWLKNGCTLRHLLLSGICCGLAVGTKYNGLISLFLLTSFIPILFIRSQPGDRQKNRKSLGYAVIFLCTALFTCSPWLIRNYTWTGNPIFPLYNSLFQKTTSSSPGSKEIHPGRSREALKTVINRGSSVFVYRKFLYQEKWWHTLLLPIRFFFQGQDNNPRYFDGKLTPFLFLLPFFAFTRTSPTKACQFEKFTLLAFSLLFFFFTFFYEAMRIRYIACSIPGLVILSIFGLQNIFLLIKQRSDNQLRMILRPLGPALLFLMFAYNTNYLIDQFSIIRPIAFLNGTISREQYLNQNLAEYRTIQYANSQVSVNDKVLCLFLGNRGYYMNFKPVFEKPSQKGVFARILKSAKPDKDIKSELQSMGINFLLLREDLTAHWYQRLDTSDQTQIATFFQQDTKNLFSSGGYSFYRIRE